MATSRAKGGICCGISFIRGVSMCVGLAVLGYLVLATSVVVLKQDHQSEVRGQPTRPDSKALPPLTTLHRSQPGLRAEPSKSAHERPPQATHHETHPPPVGHESHNEAIESLMMDSAFRPVFTSHEADVAPIVPIPDETAVELNNNNNNNNNNEQQAMPPHQATGTDKHGPSSSSMNVDGRMNVLMIIADDLRSQLSVYDKQALTPNLERLAKKGLSFDRAYAQVTVCNPSRNSFMTGRTPDITQVWNFERQVGGEWVSIPGYFKANGYTTLGAGKTWHWSPGPGDQWSLDVLGYFPDSNEYQKLIRHERALQNATVTPMDLPAEEYMDAQIATHAVKAINLGAGIATEAREKGESAPFFVAVGFHLPHEPYVFPKYVWDKYEDIELDPLVLGMRPYGMPAYALGDLQAPFSYRKAPPGKNRNNERQGVTYGPAKYDVSLSAETNLLAEHVMPTQMRKELLKGYCAGVTFMDEQFGKVLDALEDNKVEDSTVIVFFADHGFALGDRGQWGKRSLFESDARVPYIISDPRFTDGHGVHTTALAELIDVYPTLLDLAGLPPAHSMVPPLSGVSQGPVVRKINTDNAHGFSGVRTEALTQFSRCPITSLKQRDYRSSPFGGAISWECSWKGWEWNEYHDLAVMGYSIRVDEWRYTAWLPWYMNETQPLFVYPPFGEELYHHSDGIDEGAGTFDSSEFWNLLSPSVMSRQRGDTQHPYQAKRRVYSSSANLKTVARRLFEQMRSVVLRRLNTVKSDYYKCMRIGPYHDRIKCMSNYMGVDLNQRLDHIRAKHDYRDQQANKGEDKRLLKEVIPVPLLGAASLYPTSTTSSYQPSTFSFVGEDHRTIIHPDSHYVRSQPVSEVGFPPIVRESLRRLNLLADEGRARLNFETFVFERFVKADDIIIVGGLGPGKLPLTYTVRKLIPVQLDDTNGVDIVANFTPMPLVRGVNGSLEVNHGTSLNPPGQLSASMAQTLGLGFVKSPVPSVLYISSKVSSLQDGSSWESMVSSPIWMPLKAALAQTSSDFPVQPATLRYYYQLSPQLAPEQLQIPSDPTKLPSSKSSSSAKEGKPTPMITMEAFSAPPHRHHPLNTKCTTFIDEFLDQRLVKCINASLQVQSTTRVHLISPDNSFKGWRFFHLISQGLRLHPAIEIVGPNFSHSHNPSTRSSLPVTAVPQEFANHEQADLIFYLPTSTNSPPYTENNVSLQLTKEECTSKLVVLDEGDGVNYYPPVREGEYLAYFKRSWVKRKNGHYDGVPRRRTHNYMPMIVSEDYLANELVLPDQREFDISCTLRAHEVQPARSRVVQWVSEALEEFGLAISGGGVGELNKGQRKEINQPYFSAMRASKIVITCNPSSWEGDFRLYEAMASGALVFVDQMDTPMPNPPRHGEHIVVYNNSNRTDFMSKLKYYVENPRELRRVAMNGYVHTMKYHRSVSRADYFVRSALELKRAHDGSPQTQYLATGAWLKDLTNQSITLV